MKKPNRNAVARKRSMPRPSRSRRAPVQIEAHGPLSPDAERAMIAHLTAPSPIDRMYKVLEDVFPIVTAKLQERLNAPDVPSNHEYVRSQMSRALRNVVTRAKGQGLDGGNETADLLSFVADVLDPALLATA